MGFLGIIPASKLAALYDTKQQKLTLYAQGTVQEFTYGFSFHRENFYGGLKFTLMAWTGPLGEKEQPYEYSEGFSMHLPQPHFNSASVLIVTANNPDGESVPIRYTGVIGNSNVAKISEGDAAKFPADAPVNSVVPGFTPITVQFNTPFTIKANAAVPRMGSVTMHYDNTVLSLVSSGISDADIVWTFKALKTGHTQVIVTTSGGIAQFVIRETYDVNIIIGG